MNPPEPAAASSGGAATGQACDVGCPCDGTCVACDRPCASGNGGGAGGTEYVRGYYRRNGTYVAPYTRRR